MLAMWMYFWSTADWVASTAPTSFTQWLIQSNQIIPPNVSLR